MPLAAGVRLGAYEVLGLIGAGGMGEVYKARDTRLDRTVAIKVLSEQFADDPDRRARFEREARAVAALNHSHICALHDVGEAPGPASTGGGSETIRFLVMEYLEGQTLAERLLRGPLPAAETLRYAIELADALDHAHRRGVVHRDLKPGNVMLTTSGAKLLDFGLSKLEATPDLLALSTLAPGDMPLTAASVVLGTYPYMAPEQLAGRDADARSDIFAFGAMLHEMATGQRAFQGTTAATVIGAVLHTDPPPVSSLQPLAPPAIDRIASRCLAKDPDDRWQNARDLMLELKWIAESHADAPVVGPTLARLRRRARAAWLVSGAMFLLASAAGTGVAYLWRRAPDESAQRLSLLPPPAVRPADPGAGGGASISPDGSRVAFAGIGADGKHLLWIRRLDVLDAQPLAATEGAEYPFWSPDSRSIGFFAQGKLKRISADGGPSLTLCDAPQPRGGTWNADGVVLFSANAGERWYRVAAAGGAATSLTIDRPSSENYWPVFLPDGRHFLYFGRPEKPGIYVASLDSNDATFLLGEHVGVAYAPPGYLLSLAGSSRSSEDRTLVARPFDATRLQITGEPAVVAEHVAYQTLVARAAFSASGNGSVVYESVQSPATRLIWFDREGKQLSTLGEAVGYLRPSLSPDGKSVAVERPDTQTETTDIWLLETTRGVASRLTVDPNSEWFPVWSPDGSRVVFTSPRGTSPQLYQQDSRKAGPGDLLLKGSRTLHPRDWSRDGRFLVYATLDPKTQWDLWILPMQPAPADVDRTGEPFLQSAFNEHNGQFSPDGRWMAYVSDESGTLDVYVRPFPKGDSRWRISASGGRQPRWRGDGRELFYIASDGTLMAVMVAGESTLEVGAARMLFRTRIAEAGSFSTSYAVTGDGQRFLMSSITEDTAPSSMTVLLNWRAALGRR